MTFPDHIQIPVVLAAGLRFEGDLTARDQSILLVVAWYAAMQASTMPVSSTCPTWSSAMRWAG